MFWGTSISWQRTRLMTSAPRRVGNEPSESPCMVRKVSWVNRPARCFGSSVTGDIAVPVTPWIP